MSRVLNFLPLFSAAPALARWLWRNLGSRRQVALALISAASTFKGTGYRYCWYLAVALAMAPLMANAENIRIDCGSSSKDAQLQVPKPADKLARISCTKYGHIVEPQKGWLWNGLGGAVAPIIFPAQMVNASPTVTNNDVYFRSLTVKELAGKEAKKKWLAGGVTRDVQAGEVKKALELVAVSSQGGRQTLYFFDNGWGYGCSQECAKGLPFKLLSGNSKQASW